MTQQVTLYAAIITTDGVVLRCIDRLVKVMSGTLSIYNVCVALISLCYCCDINNEQ